MFAQSLVRSWDRARQSLIAELDQVPADKFDFRSTPETRSVAEIVRHILEAQKVFVAEICRPDKDMDRQAVFGAIKQYAAKIAHIGDKEGLIALLKDTMKSAAETITSLGDDGLREEKTQMDGQRVPRFEMLNFMIGHEMYHCGQVAVYERLIGIEPALTGRFKKAVAAMEQKQS
ncbi:MAG TPA: DinB family protein [Blastocatellia bacterium]